MFVPGLVEIESPTLENAHHSTDVSNEERKGRPKKAGSLSCVAVSKRTGCQTYYHIDKRLEGIATVDLCIGFDFSGPGLQHFSFSGGRFWKNGTWTTDDKVAAAEETAATEILIEIPCL